MQVANAAHLTYCTNIHAANGWSAVLATLEHYGPGLKAALATDRPFGIGLRLSGVESRQLLEADRLSRFKDFLDHHGLYVFAMNGFPHGPFHGQPVKEFVHAPDWRDQERVDYIIRLATILAAILPDGVEGGISTSPLSYKAWVDLQDGEMWKQVTRNVVAVAEALHGIADKTGRQIHLAIEPEPDGLVENSHEVVDFFERWLLSYGAEVLARKTGLSRLEARERLLDHIRICYDTCHVAVAYEEPAEVLERFASYGIRVGRVQISSALKVGLDTSGSPRKEVAQALEPFAESTYLHQVIQRNQDESLRQYPDLPHALPCIQDSSALEWRIHYHVPIFLEHYGILESTQAHITETLRLQREHPFTQHLEIETYTWDVLPGDLKTDLLSSIQREYEWVLSVL